MTSKHNFNLHDDNFWTNAFRLCEELQSEAGSAAEEERKEEEEKEEQTPPPAARPRLCLKGAATKKQGDWKDEEEDEIPAHLPVEQWGAVKAQRSCSWNLQQTASTPPDDSMDDGARSESWSDSSSHSVHGGASHHPMLSSQHVPIVDDKYCEYFEFLSDGFNKLLEDVHGHGAPPPPWMLNAGDVKCGGGDMERGDRYGRFGRPPPRRNSGNGVVAVVAPSAPVPSSLTAAFDCGEKAGLGCAALKPRLYHQYNPGPEVYSRKVFVGGLPVDVDEDELLTTFAPFGHLTIDWPNKQLNMQGSLDRSFPPKGYVFLIFQYELSVRKLVEACHCEEEKLFFSISSAMSPQKLVQIRPWKLADADYIVDVNMPINPRRVIFVGGVPRPIRAVELAHIMDKLYGSVVCAGIDTDLEYKYPKGAGRVAFTNEASFIRAITDRYAQLSHGERVRVEMKPYVLDDQPCDECDGNAARHAPFFCPHLECLQYYCENCWTELHACPTREHHKPLVKEA